MGSKAGYHPATLWEEVSSVGGILGCVLFKKGREISKVSKMFFATTSILSSVCRVFGQGPISQKHRILISVGKNHILVDALIALIALSGCSYSAT